MAEIDLFERSLAGAFLRLADDVPGTVDAAAVAHRVAHEHPHRGARVLSWGRVAIPRLAWVLLLGAALLAALVGGALLVGSQPQRRLPAVVPNLRPVPTCPPGSTPDKPGPVDQARPLGFGPWAFDRRAGKLVVVAYPGTGVQTWTFDVCTNTWTQMHPNREPLDFAFRPLVYDIDSGLTLGVASGPDGAPPGRVWAYDLQADTWTEKGVVPTNAALWAYDPLSGLVVATVSSLDNTAPAELWEYAVETDTWTPTPIHWPNPPIYMPDAYDASVDRIIAFGSPTWLLDLRTDTWSRSAAETPLIGGCWAVPTITYDEAAERTVIAGCSGWAAYDAAGDRWEVLAGSGGGIVNPIAYDPVNRRLIGTRGIGCEGDMVAFDLVARECTVLLEPSTGPVAPEVSPSPGQ